MMKHWQGCWNERDAILSVGTLAIQVFFDGKPQPIAASIEGLTSAAMHPFPEAVNGKNQSAVLPEPGSTAFAPGAHPGDREEIIVQDLFIIAEPRTPSAEQPQDQEKTDDEAEDRFGSEAGEETEDELSEGRDDEPDEEPEDEVDDEIGGREAAGNASLERQKDLHASVRDTPAIEMRIAAFHANLQHVEETLDALKRLMATMPPKTVLIDLRQHRQIKKRQQDQSGLSKDHLRSVFGGTYWDRGWAIQTAYRSVSTSECPSGWRRVVIHPESPPDGIAALVRFLQEGYSMVVIDQMAPYAQSPRRGVIEELQNRLPGLIVGPLG